jgi:hypothetical protein
VVSSLGEQGAVRPAVAAGAAGSPDFIFAMAGAIGGAQWRSPPPSALSYAFAVRDRNDAGISGLNASA